MASLLGNLIFTGLQTLLTTQAALGNSTNLYSINTGVLESLDTCLFQLGHQGAAGAGLFAGATLPPTLYTRTGAVSVWVNPNTTAISGDILAAAWHTRIQ